MRTCAQNPSKGTRMYTPRKCVTRGPYKTKEKQARKQQTVEDSSEQQSVEDSSLKDKQILEERLTAMANEYEILRSEEAIAEEETKDTTAERPI